VEHSETCVVTGGLSYIGKHITQRLISERKRVIVLTGHPNRPNPFQEQIRVVPFNFNNQTKLIDNLRSATTLFNTYWVRFDYGQVTFENAIQNTRRLIEAAKQAGIRKVVHLSVSNPSEDSPFPYFRGKAVLEQMVRNCGLPFVIIRPTLVYGGQEEILINNIAWLLQHFPIFAIPHPGESRLQPIFVKDLANFVVTKSQIPDNTIVDAAGPETFTFEEMVRLIAQKMERRPYFLHVNPTRSLFLLKVIGWFVRDIVLTKDELGALMANLLIARNPPVGKTRLKDWLDESADHLGRRYASELVRHYR
jgi:nucleoside-diphosphate-sugar epimerase